MASRSERNYVELEGIIQSMFTKKSRDNIYIISLKVPALGKSRYRPKNYQIIRCILFSNKSIDIRKNDPLFVRGHLEEDVWGIYVFVKEYRLNNTGVPY